jgi:hypothetical protein
VCARGAKGAWWGHWCRCRLVPDRSPVAESLFLPHEALDWGDGSRNGPLALMLAPFREVLPPFCFIGGQHYDGHRVFP